VRHGYPGLGDEYLRDIERERTRAEQRSRAGRDGGSCVFVTVGALARQAAKERARTYCTRVVADTRHLDADITEKIEHLDIAEQTVESHFSEIYG
jgi:hypothetical protein